MRTLPPGHSRQDESLAAARAASRLADPRLARIYDVDGSSHGAYIVTEWPSGDSLADLLADGPLLPADSAAILAAAADALAVAHAAGVSHLCLTLRSVLWSRTTGVKIFGLGIDAALAGARADDPPSADARGLAKLLYSTLTARWPGTEHAALPPAPQRAGVPYPPDYVRAGVPKQLDLVVRRALLGQTRAGQPPITTPAQLAGALASFARPGAVAGAADPVGGHGPPGFLDRPPGLSRLALVGAAGFAALIFSVAAWGVAGGSAQATRAAPSGPPERTVDPPGPTVAASPLTPVSSVLYESSSGGEGHAALAIDDSPDTAWRSHWYTTASFGNLKSGLGLLVDMGSPVSVSSVRVLVGATPGADLELRVGDAADNLASLRVMASVRTTAGATELSAASPVAGRYVLLWFTSLPPQDGGTGRFQATVRDVTVFGAT